MVIHGEFLRIGNTNVLIHARPLFWAPDTSRVDRDSSLGERDLAEGRPETVVKPSLYDKPPLQSQKEHLHGVGGKTTNTWTTYISTTTEPSLESHVRMSFRVLEQAGKIFNCTSCNGGRSDSFSSRDEHGHTRLMTDTSHY